MSETVWVGVRVEHDVTAEGIRLSIEIGHPGRSDDGRTRSVEVTTRRQARAAESLTRRAIRQLLRVSGCESASPAIGRISAIRR